MFSSGHHLAGHADEQLLSIGAQPGGQNTRDVLRNQAALAVYTLLKNNDKNFEPFASPSYPVHTQ
jgi:hypothetical protein